MRRLLFMLCFTFMSLILTSCSNDDDASDVNLIGTWKLTEINTQQAYDVNYNGTSSFNLLDEIGELNEMEGFSCMENETLTFNTSNIGTFSSTSDFDVEVYIYDGQEAVEIDCDPINDSSTFAWAQNNDLVTISFNDGQTNITVNANGNQLSFVLPDYLYTFDTNTGIETYDDVTFVYTKQ